jgi:hypothetical protein
MLNLAQAAALTGMNRSSILRAIKRGAITGTKDHNDVWHVDGAELARVFPVTPPNAQPARQDAQPPQQDAHADALAAAKLALAEERIAELKERLEEMRRDRDRAQAGEDAWKAQCELTTRHLALAAPTDAQPAAAVTAGVTTPWRRFLRWRNAAG